MTSPFTDALVSRLKGATAWRFGIDLDVVFSPRFFCCTDPNELGIVDGKEPVAIFTASSYQIITGSSVSFNGSASYDPDGSITDYSWSFGGGTPSSGTAVSESVSFGTAGKKTVRLTVTDGTGKRSVPATAVIKVVDAGDAFGTAVGGGVYVGSLTGVYYSNDSGQTWDTRTAGLSGDGLKVRDLSQDPATFGLPNDNTVWWAATDGGLYVSIDGGSNWADRTPTSALTSPSYISLQWYGDILYVAAYSSTDADSAIYYANVSVARAGNAPTWGTV